MDDKIFSIIKISYDSIGNFVGDSCGTCFFVSKNNFITCNHCFNNEVFIPNPNFPFCKVLLVNTEGKHIDSLSFKGIYEDLDLVIGETSDNIDHFSIKDFELGNLSLGDCIFNIGFPEKETIKNNIINGYYEGNDLNIKKIEIESKKQNGIIDEIKKETYNDTNDQIKIIDKKFIIPNYSSRTGFSGGPLISKKTNKIIGIMSLSPNNPSRDSNNRVRAISFEEILKSDIKNIISL